MKNVMVTVQRRRLEPGRHIARRWLEVLETKSIALPFSEAAELRPDWGVWLEPVVTFTAIERALRARGELGPLPGDETWTMSVPNDQARG